jgi:hypothetical protein
MQAETKPYKWIGIGILLLAFLFLAVIFVALDFKAGSSTTTAESQMITIRSGDGETGNLPLVIYVQAPENVNERLRQELFNRAGTLAPFSTMSLIETPGSDSVPDSGSAALVVAVDRRTYVWTPFYATTQLSVRVAFASDGQVDWDQLGQIVPDIPQASSAIRFRGDLEIRDRSLGLISHPGYRSHLAQQISDKVLESVRTALAGSTP